ncbi:MAG TPA: hypothetical protein VM820_13140 [Vicinamibacterales bacterium]|jgi:hypothetical protein|nr:hypothetical protein [Vicinamibacterales bacterium]
MADFNIRSESVDVEQIMTQIRGRIAEKRGVDYTEEQIRELATVRLEKFLDPKNLRSDLLEQFRRSRPAINVGPEAFQAPYTFDDQTLFASHRAPLRFIRRLLLPILKLFFNPNTLNQVLHTQAQFNVDMLKRDATRRVERAEWNSLYYEVLHNLVLETTRMSIEVKNLRMRVESLSSRLDFSERRVRALEGVVQYRPEAMRPRERREPLPEAAAGAATEGVVAEGLDTEAGGVAPRVESEGLARRRRRRRRGRRGQREGFAGASPESGAAVEPDADTAGDSDAETDGMDAADADRDTPPSSDEQ